jgi:DNA-binding transcriptional ArsR family regulator
MSTAVTRFEWDRAVVALPLPPITDHVAARLAMHADGRTGEHAHPGVDRLAVECGLSEKTVSRHLKILRDLGLIERTYRGRGNQYGRTADEYALRLPPDILARVRRWLTENSASGLLESGTNLVRYRTLRDLLADSEDLLGDSDDLASGLLESTHQSRNHGRVPRLDQSPTPLATSLGTHAREAGDDKTSVMKQPCPDCGHRRFSADGACLRCGTITPQPERRTRQ